LAKKLFIVLFNYNSVWKKLRGPKPPFTRSFPDFEENYGRILQQYAKLGRKYGLELYFSFNDEPFENRNKRSSSYYCSKIAQQHGLKTWSTHRLKSDKQLNAKDHPGQNIYLRPLREVLNVFVDCVIRIDEQLLQKFKDCRSNLSFYTTYVATSVRPTYNRVLHGVYPFIVKSEFVVSYAYRDALADPYNDLDARARDPWDEGMNDYLLTYPTWKGPILPTLSYEALREGVEDSRLISTALTLSDRAMNSDNEAAVAEAKKTKQFLNKLFSQVSKDFAHDYWNKHKDGPVDPMEQAILRDLIIGDSDSYQVFEEIRHTLLTRIKGLQKSLETSGEQNN